MYPRLLQFSNMSSHEFRVVIEVVRLCRGTRESNFEIIFQFIFLLTCLDMILRHLPSSPLFTYYDEKLGERWWAGSKDAG